MTRDEDRDGWEEKGWGRPATAFARPAAHLPLTNAESPALI
jgi:hypothetical protein